METEGILLSQGVAKKVRFELGDLGRDEVLIETKACGICMGEIYVYRGKLPGGRVMGHEGVGVVAEVGEDVNNVEVGDRVTTLGGPALAKYYKDEESKCSEDSTRYERLCTLDFRAPCMCGQWYSRSIHRDR